MFYFSLDKRKYINCIFSKMTPIPFGCSFIGVLARQIF
ncbi:hypothetical protein ADIS_2458 [Lunatimonas lonarensis]|uniref:Uncharacterized protein n=1 Tax=Lunatimonas lonarensis TaxID=1232681 RepID=R7ZSG5_9BACT|nr:hypothetical protein ADIS_2458 [Lunatimonas lonarensis]